MPFAAPFARALLRSQSDERLVKLARDSHQGAFDEIVRRYRAPLVAFAAAYATTEKAEDVVQEGLTNAWLSLQASEREIALKPWLYAIVRNRALNARRDTRFHEQLDETIDGVRRPEDIVLEREELRRTVAAVAALPEGQRKALVDSAVEGRTHDQIAAELGTSPGSVRGLIHRGRVAVRTAAGSVVPFPVLAWAAGSGGAAAGGVAAGSVVGGSIAAKGVTVAVIAVLATGSGIVVERSLDDSARSDRQANADGASERGRPGHGDGGARDPEGGENPEGGEGRGPSDNSGEGEQGDDSGRSGDNDDPGDDGNSRPGGGGPSAREADDSGPGSSNSGSESEDDDSSGSGSEEDGDDSSDSGSGDDSGSDSSSSDSSGSGSDESEDEEDEEDEDG